MLVAAVFFPGAFFRRSAKGKSAGGIPRALSALVMTNKKRLSLCLCGEEKELRDFVSPW